MKTWVRKTLAAGVLAAGALLLAPAAAHADVDQNTWDNTGILNGTQLVAPINVPVNLIGTAIGVAGEAHSAGVGVNHLDRGGKGKGHHRESGNHRDRDRGGVNQNSWDNTGALNGTQAYLPVNVPVNVVGTSVAALFGEADAAGVGVNQIDRTESKQHRDRDGRDRGHRGPQNSWDNTGILNGTQIYAPISVPINACGTSLSLLFGEADSGAFCHNNVSRGHRTETVRQNSGDNTGIGNGTQLFAPITLPVNLAGTSVAALFGESDARGVAVNEAGRRGGDRGFQQNSGDNKGLLNGTQIAAPIDIPVNVCGTAVSLLGGEADASGACANGSGNGRDRDRDRDHDGDHGDNDGDWGHDDDQYDGDKGDDKDDYKGDGDAAGDGYGDADADGYGQGGREVAGKKAEGLTDGLGGLGGLLNTLR